MAHNFKLTGNTYISKAGSDANDGLTPNTPKSTVGIHSSASGQTVVIGAGTYIVTANLFTGAGRTFRGDGYVKLLAAAPITFYVVNSGSLNVQDIVFENFGNVAGRSGSNGNIIFQNCIFKDCAINSGGYAVTTFSNCVFINCTGNIATSIASNGAYTVSGNIFINCTFNIGTVSSSTKTISRNYFDENSDITIESTANFSTNNCNSPSLSTKVGSNSNINLPPQFNNQFAQDFTLKRTSPHLSRNIGPSWLRLGNSFFLKGDEEEVTDLSGHYFEGAASGQQFPIYEATNLVATLQEGQLRMKIIEAVDGEFTGKFKVKLRLSDVPVSISTLNFVAGLNFNTDYPSSEGLFNPNNPQVLNNNVPNGFNWTSGHEGRNPNRLDYSLRWSTKDNPDLNTSSDWITGEGYLIFEWNTVPIYNPVSLKGNADPDFQTAPTDPNDAPKAIIATWIDIEVTLMNNYYSK